MLKRTVVGSIVALGLASATAQAAEDAAYYYVGIGAGAAKIQSDDMGFDGESTGFKVYGGFAATKYFGAEFGYFDTGVTDDLVGTTPTEMNANGFTFSLRGIWPITDSISAFVKFGGVLYDLDTTVEAGSKRMRAEPDDSESNYTYGAGAEMVFLKSFGLRLEYDALHTDSNDFDTDIEMIMLTGIYKF